MSCIRTVLAPRIRLRVSPPYGEPVTTLLADTCPKRLSRIKPNYKGYVSLARGPRLLHFVAGARQLSARQLKED